MLTLISKKRKKPPTASWLRQTYVPAPSHFHYHIRLMYEYGPIVRLPILLPIYVANDPLIAQQLFQSNAENYLKNDLFYTKLRTTLGPGLLTNEGAPWARHRQLLQPFFNHQRLKKLVPLITTETEQLLAHWAKSIQQEKRLNVVNDLYRVTCNIASKGLFGFDLGDNVDFFVKKVSFCDKHAVSFQISFPRLPTPKNIYFHLFSKKINQLLADYIQQYGQQAIQDNNILGLLLQEQQAHPEISDAELISEIRTFLVTGYETTGTALGWACYCMAKYPSACNKMVEEINRVLGDRTPTEEDLMHLDYSKMFFKEVLRLHPPLWMIARKAQKDDELMGYHIPANSTIILSTSALHRNPDYWQDAETFNPERFSEIENKNRGKYTYIPFGGGARACIAQALAMQEGPLMLACIAKKIRFSLVKWPKVKEAPHITLQSKYGIHLRLHPR